MPQAKQLDHRHIGDTTLPYQPSISPLADQPAYLGGRDVLTSWKGFSERRPGWTAFESSPQTQAGQIKRQFTWRKWAGTFYQVINVITGNQSFVLAKATGDPSYNVLFVSNSTNIFNFLVSANYCFFGNGVDMMKWDGASPSANVTNWGIAAPVLVPTISLSGTGITLVTGRTYVYCYGSSVSGGLSSPSPISASTGQVTNQSVQVGVTASPDTQVDQIHVFSTTDGGGGVYYEVVGSPIGNADSTFADTTADTALSTLQAPIPGFNDPPTPSTPGVWYASRLWTYVNNRVYYSGWEEINNGFEEECFPSGFAGNFYAFPSEVTGLSTVPGAVIVNTADAKYTIQGDSLETFRRDVLFTHMGARSQSNTTQIGKLEAWLDISDTVHITDGFSEKEISLDIRSDLSGIDHTQSSMCFHTDGKYRWLVLLDNGRSLCYIYDVDREQWLPPWTFGGYSIYSGETSVGHYELLLGATNKVVNKMTLNAYLNPDLTTYAPYVISTLVPLYRNTEGFKVTTPAGHVGELEYLSVETDAQTPTKVEYMTDDDPLQGTWKDITVNAVKPPQRDTGQFIKELWFYNRTKGRRQAVRVTWGSQNANFKFYSFDFAFKAVGIG